MKKKTFGKIFVISAPSGTGKSTLCKKLTGSNRGLKLSVSYTTRPPRKGEKNDVHYTFVTENRFRGMIKKGDFAEWAVVHGNFYGTSLKRLKKMSSDGYDIILDIDVRGAMQLKERLERAVYIFILPPSMKELKKRLLKRKSESEDKMMERLENAREEIGYCKHYDYAVINDKLKKAYRDIECIIRSETLRAAGSDHASSLLKEKY